MNSIGWGIVAGVALLVAAWWLFPSNKDCKRFEMREVEMTHQGRSSIASGGAIQKYRYKVCVERRVSTTTPNPLVATINHERMPVLLTREEEFSTWLEGPPTRPSRSPANIHPAQMRIVREGAEKRDEVALAA